MILKIFQGFSLFSYQCSLLHCLATTIDMVSNFQVFVNNFFKFFIKQGYKDSNLEMTESESVALPFGDSPMRFSKLFSRLRHVVLYINAYIKVNPFFQIFLNSVLSSLSCDSLFILSKCFAFVKNFFHFLLHLCFKAKESAGGGIRTHAPLRTNGFQDRLVMTTSIPLRVTINT